MKKFLEKIKDFFKRLKIAFLKSWSDLKTHLKQSLEKSKKKQVKVDKEPSKVKLIPMILITIGTIFLLNVSSCLSCKNVTARADIVSSYSTSIPNIMFDYTPSDNYSVVCSYPLNVVFNPQSIELFYHLNGTSGGSPYNSYGRRVLLTNVYNEVIISGYYMRNSGIVDIYGIRLNIRCSFGDSYLYEYPNIDRCLFAYNENNNCYVVGFYVDNNSVEPICYLEIVSNDNSLTYIQSAYVASNLTLFNATAQGQYALGYTNGYDIGHSDGFNQGLSENSSVNQGPFEIIKRGVSEFMQIEIFEGLNMSTLIYISFGIFAVIILIKVFT